MNRLLYLLLSIAVSPVLLTAAPMDFNGDGISDPTVVIERNGNLNWIARVLGQRVRVGQQFGKMGTHLMPADYTGDGMTELGFVESNGKWNFLIDTQTRTRSFGASKATYIGGFDADGDGKADIAYRTNSCRSKVGQLNVLTNPLNNSTPVSFKAGRGRHHVFFMNSNGNERDELCFAKPMKLAKSNKLRGTFRAVCKNGINGSNVSKFKLGKVFSIPVRIRTGASKPDHVVLYRKRAGKTNVVVRAANSKVIKKFNFPLQGTIVVGNFTNTVGQPEQIGLHLKSGDLQVYDLGNQQIQTLTTYQGIAVDQVNISTFESGACYCDTATIVKNKGKCSSSTGGGGGDSGGSGVIAGQCQVNRDNTDGPGGFLHKPVADGRPEPVNLFKRSDDPSACWYEDSNNSFFLGAYLAGYTNPDRPTFRPQSSQRCSTYPAPLVIACNVGGKKNCWNIPNPCNRYD